MNMMGVNKEILFEQWCVWISYTDCRFSLLRHLHTLLCVDGTWRYIYISPFAIFYIVEGWAQKGCLLLLCLHYYMMFWCWMCVWCVSNDFWISYSECRLSLLRHFMASEVTIFQSLLFILWGYELTHTTHSVLILGDGSVVLSFSLYGRVSHILRYISLYSPSFIIIVPSSPCQRGKCFHSSG